MTKKLLLLLVAAALTMPAWAEEQGRAHKEESVGVGGGAAVGAIAGGPIGVIVGAALGGWLGDRFHREREKVVSSEQRYRDAQARMESLQGRLQGSKSELDELQAEWRLVKGNYRDALQVALESQVFFRTAQSALDDSAVQRLARIAELVQSKSFSVRDIAGLYDTLGSVSGGVEAKRRLQASIMDASLGALETQQ